MLSQNANLKVQNNNSKRKSELRYRCYCFSIEIIKLLETLPDKRAYCVIADQLMRCATSIGANVVEAKSSSSRRDFIKFYEIALKSANETKYWLALLRDATDANKESVNKLLAEVEEISRMLGSSVLTLKIKSFKF